MSKRKTAVAASLVLFFSIAACVTPTAVGEKKEPAVRQRTVSKAPKVAERARRSRREKSCPELTRARLKKARAEYRRSCGHELEVNIDWKGLGEGCGKTCVALVDQLRAHCEGSQPVRATVRRIKALRCTFGKPAALSQRGGVLTLHYPPDGPMESHSAWVEEELPKVALTPKLTFGEAASRELARVCLDGKMVHVLGSKYGPHSGLSTGEGTALVHVGNYRHLKGSYFYDPRFWDTDARPYRRIDMRPVSTLVAEEAQRRCALTCGTKTKQLKLADAATTQRILENATYRPRPDIRLPHALARDKRGVYYYVDRSSLKGQAKDFRVYVGKRGKLRRQKMVDVVSDSEGEIFATKRGKLRLFVGKSEALWIVKRRKKKLTRVPIADNLPMIYKELGVYWGKKLYTPCDHF